jgi:hypothetical protein
MNSKTPVSGRGFLLLNFQADPLPLEERELVLRQEANLHAP